MANERRRRAGSVRFDPYYKLQLWDAVSVAWFDVQRRFDTPEDARAATPAGARSRVMLVTESGRRPLPGDD